MGICCRIKSKVLLWLVERLGLAPSRGYCGVNRIAIIFYLGHLIYNLVLEAYEFCQITEADGVFRCIVSFFTELVPTSLFDQQLYHILFEKVVELDNC